MKTFILYMCTGKKVEVTGVNLIAAIESSETLSVAAVANFTDIIKESTDPVKFSWAERLRQWVIEGEYSHCQEVA